MPNRKYLGHSPSQKLSRRRAKKFLRRWADHDRTAVARKQQQSIFQPSHHGVHVFAHGAENFMYAAQLLANLRDFPADLAELVAASRETFNLRPRCIVL